jgi:hypothetical protein
VEPISHHFLPILWKRIMEQSAEMSWGLVEYQNKTVLEAWFRGTRVTGRFPYHHL